MPHFLIADSELPHERAGRRKAAGKSAGESYAATLAQLAPDARIAIAMPADDYAQAYAPEDLAGYDAVFVTGSPLHVYEDTPAVRRQIAFMGAVYASGTPSFGSCAGLQIAVVTAGGTVRKITNPGEAGIARRITPTAAGRDHPLLAGRPPSWDAPAVHGDEVDMLPPGATLLAGNAATRVQALEIRHDGGVFWGVQYHPELAPGEIAIALRRQAADLIEKGFAKDEAAVEAFAERLNAVHEAPEDRAALWALGVDASFADQAQRRTELHNFIAALSALRRPLARDFAPPVHLCQGSRVDHAPDGASVPLLS